MANDTDTDKLRELAEAATPGPWRVIKPGGRWIVVNGDGMDDRLFDVSEKMMGGFRRTAKTDAAFIAAASPDAILALAAELVGLRTEVDQLRGDLELSQLNRHEGWNAYYEAKAERDAAETRAARAEQERDELRRVLQAVRQDLVYWAQSHIPEAVVKIDAALAAAVHRPVEAEDSALHLRAERDALQAEVESVTRYSRENAGRAMRAEVEAARRRQELAALQARIDAVRAEHPKGTRATSDHYYCDPDECDAAGEGELAAICRTCRELWPCPTVAALGVDPQKETQQ